MTFLYFSEGFKPPARFDIPRNLGCLLYEFLPANTFRNKHEQPFLNNSMFRTFAFWKSTRKGKIWPVPRGPQTTWTQDFSIIYVNGTWSRFWGCTTSIVRVAAISTRRPFPVLGLQSCEVTQVRRFYTTSVKRTSGNVGGGYLSPKAKSQGCQGGRYSMWFPYFETLL